MSRNWLTPKPLPAWADPNEVRARFEAALAGDGLEALTSVVRAYLDLGLDEQEMLGALEALRSELREAGHDGDEDIVADVMDLLYGWCAPSVILRRSTEPPSPDVGE